MIIAVGTRNPAKLEGVRKVFVEFFPQAQVKGFDASSVTRAQPVGLRQITEGAKRRARFALSKARAEFGVGVEGGIFNLGKQIGYLEHQQAVVMHTDGRFSLGLSASFMLPAKMTRRMLREGKELEYYAVKMTGVKDVGDKEGIVFHLTKGGMNRTDLTEQCVRTALVPWLNRPLYGF